MNNGRLITFTNVFLLSFCFSINLINFFSSFEGIAPVVPDLVGDDDTSNFEDVDNKKSHIENFPEPNAFAGNNIPFIGFTYSGDYQIVTLKRRVNNRPTLNNQLSTDDSVIFLLFVFFYN